MTNGTSISKLKYVVNSSALAQSAKRLTHSEYYSEKDILKADKYVDLIIDKAQNEEDTLSKQYLKLAQTLKQYNNGNVSKEDVENEMLNTFAIQNAEIGVSKQVINEISLAFNQIGNHEALDSEGYGTDSGDEISKYFETEWYGSPWCAMFVSWLNDKGQENPDENKNTFGFQESVANIRSIAEEAGFYVDKGTYEPIPGDLIVLENGGSSHIGMVYDKDENNIYAIEGNKCDMVRSVVYDKDGSYYQNHVSGYVKMNEWSGGDTKEEINTEFLPELESAILPETQCYAVPNEWNELASGGFVNIYRV